MNRRLALGALLALVGLAPVPAAAQAPAARPKLAILIRAEGLTSDLFVRHRAHFTGGLARLSGGTVFTNAASGSTGAGRLAAGPGAGRITAAVSGSSPVVSAGLDQAWRWDGQRFAAEHGQRASRIVPVANQAIAQLISRAESPLVPPAACAGSTKSPTFRRAAGDYLGFSASPALDGAVLAVGAGLVAELGMGADGTPDLLHLNLPATARAAQAHGPGSEASCVQLLSLDRDLAGFFSQLDRGGVDYVVALAGSAGPVDRAPLVFWKAGMPAANHADAVSTDDASPTIAAILGIALASAGPGRCLAQVPGVSCPR